MHRGPTAGRASALPGYDPAVDPLPSGPAKDAEEYRGREGVVKGPANPVPHRVALEPAAGLTRSASAASPGAEPPRPRVASPTPRSASAASPGAEPSAARAGSPGAEPRASSPAIRVRFAGSQILLAAGAGRIATALAIAAVVWLVVAAAILHGSPGWGYDFEAYLLAAGRLGRGDPLYLSWMLAGPFRPGPFGLYLYAPPLAIATLPLTAFSSIAATDAWFVLRAALFIAACGLMPVSRRIRLLIFAIATVSEPVLTDLNLGNVSIVVMFLAVVAWRYLDRPHGSVAIAVAMSLRPTMGLFLVWWIVRRRWRAAAWTLAAGACLVAMTLPFAGPGTYVDYFRMLGHLSDMTGVANNSDLASTASRYGASTPISQALLVGGYAIAIVTAAWSLRRDREVGFMVVLGATLLLSPLLWDHYLVDLLLPSAFLASRGRPWALALPLLTWLPGPIMPLLALAATIMPLLALRNGGRDRSAGEPGGERRYAPRAAGAAA